MGKALQVISDIGEGKDKDLLLELPLEFASGLNIQADGRVDTKQLLDLFSALLCQEDQCEIDNDNLSIQERIDLFLNIYDSDRSEE
ncbi:MAG: hypothetical protein K0Q57_759 [Gammaproteobacteria bacterium]|jgi:hypothetical protein|nr:hypothetical protein [Gammaproteobacteria bacterium]